MTMEKAINCFDEADEVADGMIPDSQIVNIIKQITSAEAAKVESDDGEVKQELEKTT